MNSQPPQAVRALPHHVIEVMRRAETCLRRGEFMLAGELLDKGLALAPEHPDLMRRKAVCLHMQGRFEEAAAAWRRVLRFHPDDPSVYNNLGSALGAAGDFAAAAEALGRACELAPQRPNNWFNLAKSREAAGDAEGACTALTRVLDLEPTDTKARALRADSLKTLGRIEQAEADLRQVIASDPNSIEAWVRLASLKSGKVDGRDLIEIGRVHALPNISPEYRISLGFAYGQALEAHADFKRAFSVLVEANKSKRQLIQWDASATSRFVDATMSAFEKPVSAAADAALGSEVIFLFGMPRSGSTLLEQILSAHHQVEGAGEIGDLSTILYEESVRRGADIPEWAPLATAEEWSGLGKSYLERTARWRQRRPIFTDKDLGKWQNLGAVRAMLPGARFIHCRRDPLETCWSCFKHEFQTDLLYSYDFTELAAYWHDYVRLMRFWDAKYPDMIYDYVYEDLIDQPEREVRRLLDYCGLPFDPACMQFHQVNRQVRTASAGQVRKPLYRNSDRSAGYGSLLNPLREKLGLATVDAEIR